MFRNCVLLNKIIVWLKMKKKITWTHFEVCNQLSIKQLPQFLSRFLLAYSRISHFAQKLFPALESFLCVFLHHWLIVTVELMHYSWWWMMKTYGKFIFVKNFFNNVFIIDQPNLALWISGFYGNKTKMK